MNTPRGIFTGTVAGAILWALIITAILWGMR